ncbi:colicin immunity protein [Burkholderia pyrrocinia]|uniref:colicin immunity protein n=1 Tax=Burkholderia pyrrocinia TaxID=60550 RepID=UPI0030D2AE6C
MNIDRSRIYASAEDFFTLGGSVIMKLASHAAVSVCKEAAARGILVIRIEGGIWHNPGFEARIDCIWDSKVMPPIDRDVAHASNMLAADFVESERLVHDVFIITSMMHSGDA